MYTDARAPLTLLTGSQEHGTNGLSALELGLAKASDTLIMAATWRLRACQYPASCGQRAFIPTYLARWMGIV